MRLLKYAGYALLILLIPLLLVFGYLYYATNNPQTGTLHLKGLQGPVIVTRDQYGIPHINALKSDDDAFFALGYIQAQDRFWQMEMQRRITQGTLSEIFGPAAVSKDKFLRTFGFYRAAQAAWPAYDAQSQLIVQSYTAGINAFLATGKLPLQIILLHYTPQPWTVIDSIAW